MQTSTIILIVGAIQLLLLIIEVYLVASLRMYYDVRFSGHDILLLVVQVCNLILLLQCFAGYTSIGGINIGNTGGEWMIFALQGIIILLLLFRFSWLLHKLVEHRQRLLKPRAIRETVDYLPNGICFATPSGRLVLTNRKMNELIYHLTGHVIMNVRLAWDELCSYISANGCMRLNEPWINLDYFDKEPEAGVFFSLPDNSIWRFQLKELNDSYPHYIQLEATDISELYGFCRELYNNNQRLAGQYERQQRLLADIVEINHAKEILSMKMRIHDDLGQSILTTKRYLSNETLTENMPNLAELWSSTIRCLEDYTQAYTDAETTPEIELHKAAEMIGCRIVYNGVRPTERKTTLLFYASVREALTNAVRHAAADELYVTILPIPQEYQISHGYHVEISSNGKKPVPSLTEGNGLGNLRKRLEQEGATLELRYGNSVIMIVELPAEGRDTLTQPMPAQDIFQYDISSHASSAQEG